jgi:two-component system response regulator AtoC
VRVLVVDDEASVRDSLRRALELEGFEVSAAEDGLAAERLLQEEVLAAALVDLRMPVMDGLALLGRIRQRGLRLPVLMISAYGEIQDAVAAMKEGAQDYLVKPFAAEELLLRLRRAIEDQGLRNIVEAGRQAREQDLIGDSPAMQEILLQIEKLAASPSTVLITGESGSGKEVVARLLHARSGAAGPFVAVNIGGLPESLIESELFGHERGAFTGADARKPGTFELASGGTLFLDEIGEIPMGLQVKLLRVLQEKRLRRLGGTQDLPVDARIVSATHRDLAQAVRDGAFREDLYYRVNVVRIAVPPLRERPEDIPLLAGRLLERLGRRLGRRIEGISPEALRKLQGHSFPGNVRELENLLERACILAGSDTIEAADIHLAVPGGGGNSLGRDSGVGSGLPEPATLRQIEQRSILAALQRWEGNRTLAARELGISRRSLQYKLKGYGAAASAEWDAAGNGAPPHETPPPGRHPPGP